MVGELLADEPPGVDAPAEVWQRSFPESVERSHSLNHVSGDRRPDHRDDFDVGGHQDVVGPAAGLDANPPAGLASEPTSARRRLQHEPCRWL